MTRQELELKAKEFDSKLKRHPMSSEDLQKVLCDFVEALRHPPVSGSFCKHYGIKKEVEGGVEFHCRDCGIRL